MAQHPAINHAVILREIRQLRRSFDVHTASVRSPDRPLEKLSPEERDEESRTYYVKADGLKGAIRAHLSACVSHPAAYLSTLFYALGLGGLRPASTLFHFGYFTQALMVGRWMGVHGLSHLHVHYSSTVGLLLKRVFAIGLSISFHGPDEFNDPAGFLIREKVRACDFVRAISQYARSQLMKSSDYADWQKIEVVYMGVDPAAFSARPFRLEPSPFELICVGRLAPVKAQHILVAAVDRLVRSGRNVRLNIVGGGPDRQSLEVDVRARGLETNVEFHGFTMQDRLDELYRGADAFVLASFAEGVPGVLMEAMAMEIPCVSTWITGVPELIRNGVDGLLVAPSDDESLAAAISKLMDDSAFRRQMGQAGRERVLERFNLEENARQLASIFRRCLPGRS